MVFAYYLAEPRLKSGIFVEGLEQRAWSRGHGAEGMEQRAWNRGLGSCSLKFHAYGVNWGRLDLTGGINAYVSMQAHGVRALKDSPDL